MKYETYKTLVLSTSHLTEKLAAKLNDPDCVAILKMKSAYTFIMEPTEYGFRIYVGGTISGVPPVMRKAIKLAKKLNCRWIEYDCDGPVYEELRYYEW